MKYKTGRINASLLTLATALFTFYSLPIQAKDSAANHSVIVTAAHVIYDPQTDQIFNQCDYRPQNKRLSSIAFKAISKHNYSVNNKDKIAQAESDLVFIQLKNKAHQPTLRLTEKISNSIVEFSLISPYAGNFKQTQCQKINHPHLKNDQLLLHNCAVQGGSSGSPIVDSASGNVIAVHGGRFNIQKNKSSDKKPQLIGQGRRISPSIHRSLNQLLTNQLN